MATCIFNVGTVGNGGAFGAWFNPTANPAQDSALHEVYSAGGGYIVFSMKHDGTLWIHYSVMGTIGSAQLGSGALTLGQWVWLSACASNRDQGTNHGYLDVAATYAGGASAGSAGITTNTGGGYTSWNAVYSIGESFAGLGLAIMPTPGFGQLSKMICNGQYGFSPYSPPVADWTSANKPASGYGGYWNCRGAEQGLSVLLDDSGNGFAMSGNLQRFSAGPYGA